MAFVTFKKKEWSRLSAAVHSFTVFLYNLFAYALFKLTNTLKLLSS